MSYIQVSDLTDKMVEKIQLQNYLTKADAAIIDLAEELGVRTVADIKSDPLHFKVKRYGEVFIYARICSDFMGTNNVAILEDKYFVKGSKYEKELAQLKDEITREMLTGSVNQISDRSVGCGIIFRT